MKTKLCVSGLIVAVAVLFTHAVSFAASSPKIGYIESQSVLEQSNFAKGVRDQLKPDADKLSAEFEKKGKAFQAAREEFEKKSAVMDQNTRTKKTKELQEMQAELEKLQNEARTKYQKALAELLTKVQDVVKKIGRDEKYDFIFEAGKGGVILYGTEKDDLTRKVVQELDKMGPSK